MKKFEEEVDKILQHEQGFVDFIEEE